MKTDRMRAYEKFLMSGLIGALPLWILFEGGAEALFSAIVFMFYISIPIFLLFSWCNLVALVCSFQLPVRDWRLLLLSTLSLLFLLMIPVCMALGTNKAINFLLAFGGIYVVFNIFVPLAWFIGQRGKFG